VAAAFVAGRIVRSPNDDALANVDRKVEVFAAVEQRVVDTGFTIVGEVQEPTLASVIITEASLEASRQAPPQPASEADHGAAGTAATEEVPVSTKVAALPSAADRVVVSAGYATVGSELSVGSLIAEVSGRPLFAWPSGVPLYRDLLAGDQGADVRGLQTALSAAGYYHGTVDGKFGVGTSGALRGLYGHAGYLMPYVADGVQGFSWREVAVVPRVPARVARIAGVGTVLDAEHPLAEVETSPAVISGMATVIDAQDLKAGTKVMISVQGEAPLESTVGSVDDFTTDEKTGISGQKISVVVPSDLKATAGESVVIRPQAAQAKSLAVPAGAIRQDGQGEYVLRRRGGAEGDATADGHRYNSVRVTVGAQADGWVAIRPESELTPGQEVLISGG
jgi:hypothetical protein